MTLNDLENTMVVKLRNGGLYVVQDETIKELDEFGSKEVTFY